MKKDKPKENNRKQKFLKNDKPLDAIGGQKVFPRLRYMQPKFHSVQRRPQGR